MSTEVAICKALQMPALRELNVSDILKPVIVNIGRLYALRGQQATTEDLKFMGNELANSLLARHKGLTIEEVAIALDNGIKGDYGEYFGLNVITFLSWIQEYEKSEIRRKAIIQKSLPEVIPPTKEELEALFKRDVKAAFLSYKERGRFYCHISYSERYYDELTRRGVINFTAEEKKAAIQTAKERRIKEVRDKDKAERAQKRKGWWSSIPTASDIVKKSIIQIEEEATKGGLIAAAKVICLEHFFQDIIDKQQDIKDYLQ